MEEKCYAVGLLGIAEEGKLSNNHKYAPLIPPSEGELFK
jgi:hypothetical protein|tara:strand:+ start:310 stop:426 length:117 start_codon:yes stop_codon:yes gene_type:complete